MTPAEDTAPQWHPDRPSLGQWGVTLDEARDLLRRQMCPACGRGPWQSPLNHAAKKHGIDRFTMRDVCGLTVTESITEPELSERIRERGKQNDMSKLNEAATRRRRQRWTGAGRAKNAAILSRWEAENPDLARAARSSAGKRGAAARWDNT